MHFIRLSDMAVLLFLENRAMLTGKYFMLLQMNQDRAEMKIKPGDICNRNLG